MQIYKLIFNIPNVLGFISGVLGAVDYFGTNPPYSDMDDFNELLNLYRGRFISFVSGSMENAPATGWYHYYIFYGHYSIQVAVEHFTGEHLYVRSRSHNVGWTSWHTIW